MNPTPRGPATGLHLLLALLLVAALAFAGCSGKKGDGASSTSTTSTSASSTGTGTSTNSTSSAPANRPPAGSVSASVNGTRALFNLTGTDPDGDALNWTLSFGDGNQTGGTTLPATVSHNYTATGNLTVNFTVSDGKAPAAAYNVTIAVTGGAATTTQDAQVEYTVGQGFCAGAYPEQSAGTGTVFGELDVDPGTYGTTFTASWAFATPGSLGVQAIFRDADGTTVGDFNNVLVTELSDVVPDGAVTAWFSDCGPGGPATVTYHAG